MEAMLALIGIIVIVGACLWTGLSALYLYDRRQREQLRQSNLDRQAKIQLMEKMIDKGLPPGRYMNGEF